jgi:hypothetical protein
MGKPTGFTAAIHVPVPVIQGQPSIDPHPASAKVIYYCKHAEGQTGGIQENHQAKAE